MIKGVLFITIFLFIFGCDSQPSSEASQVESTAGNAQSLPYYNEATFTPAWYSSRDDIPEDFHRIPDFSLVNQRGETISKNDVLGKISVVDFFFTSCPGICPKMTGNMAIVQQEFLESEDVILMSHSVTPEYDSVPVLREYADLKGVQDERWHLLTGDREVIYDLGRNQYFIEEDLGVQKGTDGFIHTENFILVDQQGYIRGIYNGLNKTSVNQLIDDIRELQKS